MSSTILVTGGTGTLGRLVVPHLRDDGGKVRVLSRRSREAGEVTARLAELALGSPAGLAPDMAGPRVYPMAGLLRGYLRAAGKRRPLMPVRLPGQAARAVRAGANLAPERAVGRRTWEEFLAERVRR